MRDFVKESWKIAAAFAAGAFLLSLLIGLITRNPFGTVFLRALLLALVFAVLGAGLRSLVRTYLPELAGGGAAPPAPPDDKRGSRVDIVLDDEAAPGAPADLSGAEEVEPMDEEPADATEETAQAEAQALGELADELAEDADAADGGSGEEVMEGEEPGPPAASRAGAGDIDELPDIGPLEEPERPGARGGPGRGAKPMGGADREKAEDALKSTMARQDPATLARALRTVLKKDDKG